MQSCYSARIIKIAAGRRREADGFSPGALTAILYIFNSALLYAALFLCRRSTASLYGSSTAPGINPFGRFAAPIRTARRDAMGAQLYQTKRPDEIQMRRRRLQGGRASNPPPGAGRGGARRCAKGREGRKLTRELTRYTDNVDIATYVSGLASHCIL